jgi:hypothetical protein
MVFDGGNSAPAQKDPNKNYASISSVMYQGKIF